VTSALAGCRENEGFVRGSKAGITGLLPLSPAPQIPAESLPPLPPLRTLSVDEAEHLRHNHHASVASLRLLFIFAPECPSAFLRNRSSPTPECPPNLVKSINDGIEARNL